MSESYTTTLYQNVFKEVTKSLDRVYVMEQMFQDGLVLSARASKKVDQLLQKLDYKVTVDGDMTSYTAPGRQYGVAGFQPEEDEGYQGIVWVFFDHSAAPGVN